MSKSLEGIYYLGPYPKLIGRSRAQCLKTGKLLLLLLFIFSTLPLGIECQPDINFPPLFRPEIESACNKQYDGVNKFYLLNNDLS